MDDSSVIKLLPQKDFLEPLFRASKANNMKQTLEILIAVSRTTDGRLDLASRNLLPAALELTRSLPYPFCHQYIELCFKLLRNLCAGEMVNQSSFLFCNGVGILCDVLRSIRLASDSDSDHGISRTGLQVYANVSLAGEEHQRAIWGCLFPNEFIELGKIPSQGTCDPLCMIIYTCCNGAPELIAELCGNQGLPVLAAIVRTSSAVGFKEDWLKLLLSRICLEEAYFPQIFSLFSQSVDSENCGDVNQNADYFSPEQAYLLSVVSEILSERIREIEVSKDLALYVFEVFKRSVEVVNFDCRVKSGLPTGLASIDVLGYSLNILRDICCQDEHLVNSENVAVALVSAGLLELLLGLLHDLEAPAIIRKAMTQSENQEAAASFSCSKVCPYKGFRRDIVSLIGNCAYRMKHAQDEIREKNGILLLLQHCVIDEDNPFLKEWAIWAVRNVLEGNVENHKVVTELELQGTVNVPEIAGLGLRVEVDETTRRAKLVNCP
ncbi:hypothetical protein K2173_025012 [Erythroxylum novogranatense]|uniref:Ataxin-10 domain-containing protein n=1 Tax=Erythroxylum novogranatense TaxID=1862640 RepID=A0AAV8UGD1_9ROSI|nr:hypothetical protein K2173_025012 [Erythroxylum novogranatense]